MTRMVNTAPIVDVDGSLWSVFNGDAGICISVCDGIGAENEPHPFDGENHDGDLTLFLDEANAGRLLEQLRHALVPPDSGCHLCGDQPHEQPPF